MTGVRRARVCRVGVVDALQVPAPVGREFRDAVGAGDEESPEFVGIRHLSRVSAAHPDDRYEVVVLRRRMELGGRQPRLRTRQDGQFVSCGEFGCEETGQDGRRRMVEDHGGRQLQAGLGDECVAQFDGGQGVEPQLAEGTIALDPVGRSVSQDACGEGANRVGQSIGALGRCQCGESVPEGRVVVRGGVRGLGGGRCECLPYFGQLTDQRAAAGCGEHRYEPCPVHVRDGHQSVVPVECLLQGRDRRLGCHGPDAQAEQLLAFVTFGHAATRPGTPRDRGRRDAARPAALCQRVEVGVGCRVTALAAAAPDSGDGGEDDEGVEVVPVEEFVQVDGARDLGGNLLGERVGGGFGQQGRGGDTCRVHDCPERSARVVGRRGVAGFDQRGHGRAVGHVTGDDGGLGAELLQFGDECGRAGGVRAAAAREDEVLDAVAGEPPCHVTAERTGSAGDQRGALRCPDRPDEVGAGVAYETADEGSGGAHRHLVLAAVGEEADQPCRRTVVQGLREVHEPAPAVGALQSDDAPETPQRRLDGAGQRVGATDGHGTTGRQPQRGVDSRVAERLDERQSPCHAGGDDRVGGRRLLIEGQQRKYADRLCVLRESVVQRLSKGAAVGRRGIGLDRDHPGAVCGQRLDRTGDEQAAHVSGGHDDQPVA